MPRPNIILTIADDQRGSALGCATDPTADPVRTPHLDALAQRGCRMSRAFHAGSPAQAVCMPSRAMLHTGRGPFDIPQDMINCKDGQAYVGPPEAATLGQRLRQAGYRTHIIGKWHNDDASLARSFDTGSCLFRGGMSSHFNAQMNNWDGQQFTPVHYTGCHNTDVYSESAIDWLQRVAAEDNDQPFFLYIAFTAPHDPRITHRQWHERYPPESLDLPPNFMPEHPFDNGELRVRDEMLTPRPRDPAQTRHEMADYYAMIEHMDHAIGRLHAALAALGMEDETLIIHTADHGLAVGQHGLLGKQNLYEHSTRVPLILAGPGVPSGVDRAALCYQHDLFPTLLEAAEIEQTTSHPPGPFRSLWPAMHAADAVVHDYVGSYYRTQQRMVTDGRTKQIRYHTGDRTLVQNFDLQADPWECIDSDGAPRFACTAEACDDDFERWRQQMGDPWE